MKIIKFGSSYMIELFENMKENQFKWLIFQVDGRFPERKIYFAPLVLAKANIRGALVR